MANLSGYLKNGMISASAMSAYGTNNPADTGLQKQYFAAETKAFYAENAKWSSNYYKAAIQGLNYEDFYAYTDVYMRVSDVINPTTGKHLSDDWQNILIADANIDFIPIGAHVIFGGSTWIVANPKNVAAIVGTAIIRRCNVIYNYYDYYGNIVKIPFAWHTGEELSTTDYADDNMLLLSGYTHAAMQYNPQSALIHHNTRMVLGNQAYAVRGLVNFMREFTDDENSVHSMRFDLGRTEVSADDDFVNHIAGGLSFSWVVSIAGNPAMNIGAEQTLTATSTRNGAVVTSTEENPITYTWVSSNEEVATVMDGVVTAISAGEATISAICDQNNNNVGTFTIAVEEAVQGDYVAFTSNVPAEIEQYESATISAAYYVNGIITDSVVTWSFDRTDASYGKVITGNSVLIECVYPAAPITVTASCNGKSVSAKIELVGW